MELLRRRRGQWRRKLDPLYGEKREGRERTERESKLGGRLCDVIFAEKTGTRVRKHLGKSRASARDSFGFWALWTLHAGNGGMLKKWKFISKISFVDWK